MNPLPERLPTLSKPDSSMWIDEAIWGHRLHDEQSPWLVYLEFLNVFISEDLKNQAFSEPDGYNTLSYSPSKRLYLRNILFNNPRIENIRHAHANDADKWNAWFQEMETAHGINYPNFEYLKKHFSTFEDLYQIISIVRSTSLEMNSNKRWTSKFVFPYGEDCLYEDLHQNTRTNDRRFFGRTGELLYLMLCRTNSKKELLNTFKDKIIRQPDSEWNKIIKCLQPHETETFKEDKANRANAYLPYKNHDSFNALARDWLSILKLDIPGYDMIPHLVNLTGFHILKYQTDVSQQLMERKKPLPLICEIVAPKKTLVREISCEMYQANNLLPEQAIEYYISTMEKSREWQKAASENDAFMKCWTISEGRVLWPRKDGDYDGPNEPDRLIRELRAAALKRHRQHVANIHRNYGREIGLVSKRGTVKLRYAPTDNLLKTLLFANVPKRMELNHFLNHLADRYGLIFGDREAEQVLAGDDFDKKAFQANSRRLEQRLMSLGLLRRLSDGCAYIINPYYTRQ